MGSKLIKNTNTNILYDYQNPINPNIYLNSSSTRNRSSTSTSNNDSFNSFGGYFYRGISG